MQGPFSRLLFAAILWATTYMRTAALPTNNTFLLSLPEAVFGRGLDRQGRLQSDRRMDNATGAEESTATEDGDATLPLVRHRRAISSRDMGALVEYHNRVRSQVSPTAANMEVMVRQQGVCVGLVQSSWDLE